METAAVLNHIITNITYHKILSLCIDARALDVGYMRMVCWSIGLHGINGRRETPDDDVSLEMEVHTNNTTQ